MMRLQHWPLLRAAAVCLAAVAAFWLAPTAAHAAFGAGTGSPGTIVSFNKSYAKGSIIIVNAERKLYYVLGDGRAMTYPVAIGKPGDVWTGKSFVVSKAKNPIWIPPWTPGRVVPAGPANPLGERAIYLGWSLYRIHGTNAPSSIGRAASRGCIRMHNHHVKDLFERVHIGAPVFVVAQL